MKPSAHALTVLCIVFSLLSAATLWAKPVEFPIMGFQTVPPHPVSVTADWDEGEFGKNPPTVYNHALARIACVLSEVAYVETDPTSSTDSLSRCYAALGVQKEDIEYHYNVDYDDPLWGNDQCAFSFARKEINSATGKKTLVFVVVRGTPAGANEWISNVDIGQADDVMHQGFLKASLQVGNALLSYLLKHQIQPTNTYFLISGHSRGAAVANMVAAGLTTNDQFDTNLVYAYTFAAPNVTTDEHAQDDTFNFIWNIVNAEDIVPTVPLARDNWKYRKYGHTRTLVNAWNMDVAQYENDYYPRMNAYYTQFLKRDYAPFKLGPFIPIQITRFLSGWNKDVNRYYGKILGLHNKAVGIFNKLFPSVNDDDPEFADQATNEEAESFTDTIINWLDSTTGGLVNYATDAFIDMHANESYLAWMLALDEHELFSDVGSTQLLIKGSFECAVFSADGELLARIKDSRIAYKSIRLPIASVQIKSNLLTIGFPANADFTVALYRGSLLPTPVSVQIEQYSASGLLLETTAKQRIYPHKCVAYTVRAGKILLDADSAEITKISGEEKRHVVKDGQMGHAWDFSVVPEIQLDTNLHFGGGVHVGTQAIFGSVLITNNAYSLTKSLVVAQGIGTQQNLIGRIMWDAEAFCKFVWSLDSNSSFDIVPSFRTTLSFKPRHRMQFFVGPIFDFHIADFNDGAFTKDITERNLGTITFSDRVSAVPSIQFGIRF